ncbi:MULTISPECIES: nucleotidyltransferase domain-containing protein [Croceibacter]|uniref:nucleotidyltransferase domain-containing protein n=1 Tax=Croceibacter TaxID=216431 RepID=UPI000C4ABE66|nr:MULTISPECIES: nucleotidyltransferase [Croceibacter]MBG27021.1 nucleotidyltransferase [Croceibacter sp.]|tara:strand:+ start:411 stop:1655 length:1245 start_codon:yes stop_codon:yes gene_type:complete
MQDIYKDELNEILKRLSNELDITETEYNAAKKSYSAIGEWLTKDDSPLAKLNPTILPQGSFSLGTVVRPINDEDDIDIDLVCNFEIKPENWTQEQVKNSVGDRLKVHETYRTMIEDMDGGRRCWTLEYKSNGSYHMDILPSTSIEDLEIILEEKFYNDDTDVDYSKLAIRITDKELGNYSTETNSSYWNKSNPYGYAKWFYKRAIIDVTRLFSLNEAIRPVDNYTDKKLPLQRAVQLLKRHRDIMFKDDSLESCDKPISIIITTLASKAYDKSDNVIDALSGIVSRMRDYIEVRNVPYTDRTELWVANPINDEENFADKWSETPQKKDYFFLWLDKLEEDISHLKSNSGKGLHNLNESFSKKFGKKASDKVFTDYGNYKRTLREDNKRKMSTTTGLLGLTGMPIKKHNFYGTDE